MLYLCIGYLVFLFLVWLFFYLRWLLYLPKIVENPIFEKLKIHFKLLKIKNNLYYYKGIYIDENNLCFNGFKMQHFQNVRFLFMFMRTIKK